MMKIILATLLVTITLLSCSQDSGVFYYENGFCQTGKHEFQTKKEYCYAILNEELNKLCGHEERISQFNSECTSELTEEEAAEAFKNFGVGEKEIDKPSNQGLIFKKSSPGGGPTPTEEEVPILN